MGQRLLRMNRDFFRDIFDAGEKHYRVIKDALPANTIIRDVSMHVCFSTDDIVFKIESPDWPEVPPGNAIPFIEPILQTIDQPKSWRDNPQL